MPALWQVLFRLLHKTVYEIQTRQMQAHELLQLLTNKACSSSLFALKDDTRTWSSHTASPGK